MHHTMPSPCTPRSLAIHFCTRGEYVKLSYGHHPIRTWIDRRVFIQEQFVGGRRRNYACGYAYNPFTEFYALALHGLLPLPLPLLLHCKLPPGIHTHTMVYIDIDAVELALAKGRRTNQRIKSVTRIEHIDITRRNRPNSSSGHPPPHPHPIHYTTTQWSEYQHSWIKIIFHVVPGRT